MGNMMKIYIYSLQNINEINSYDGGILIYFEFINNLVFIFFLPGCNSNTKANGIL